MKTNSARHHGSAVLQGATGMFAAATLLMVYVGGCERSVPAASNDSATDSAAAASVLPPQKPRGVEFIDRDFGFRAMLPASWSADLVPAVQVPGRVLKVWSPDNADTIVAFVQEAGRSVTAKQMLDANSSLFRNAGCKLILQDVPKVGGHDAMSLKLSGPGTGAALGAGTVPTYQHWIAIPKGNRVLVLLLTSPESRRVERSEDFEAMVGTIKIE